jgi:hypothetical protein
MSRFAGGTAFTPRATFTTHATLTAGTPTGLTRLSGFTGLPGFTARTTDAATASFTTATASVRARLLVPRDLVAPIVAAELAECTRHRATGHRELETTVRARANLLDGCVDEHRVAARRSTRHRQSA